MILIFLDSIQAAHLNFALFLAIKVKGEKTLFRCESFSVQVVYMDADDQKVPMPHNCSFIVVMPTGLGYFPLSEDNPTN